MELIINNLSKTYSNGVKALNGVSLEISKGMFGLLGPNGAGKSSLMRTIATLQEADQGTVTLGEIDVLKQKDTVRKMLGYLPQEFGVYPKITAKQLLDHLAILKGVVHHKERKELVNYLLQKVNLYEKRNKASRYHSWDQQWFFFLAGTSFKKSKPTSSYRRNRLYKSREFSFI